MGQSAEELRAEIERTRGDLSGDLEAIGDRVSPRRMVERRTNRVKDAVGTTRERVFGRADDLRYGTTERAGGAADAVRGAPDKAMNAAEGNPLAAGAVAFGLGFLAAVVFPGSQKEAQAMQKLGEQAQPLTEQVSGAAREVMTTATEAGKEAAGDLKEAAKDHAAEVKSTAADEKSAVQQQVQS